MRPSNRSIGADKIREERFSSVFQKVCQKDWLHTPHIHIFTLSFSLSLMYSQIFVLTWRYHSPNSRVFTFWGWSPFPFTLDLPTPFLSPRPSSSPSLQLGRNSFRGPTPSSLANATIRLLRLSLPYSSKLPTPTFFFLSFTIYPSFSYCFILFLSHFFLLFQFRSESRTTLSRATLQTENSPWHFHVALKSLDGSRETALTFNGFMQSRR